MRLRLIVGLSVLLLSLPALAQAAGGLPVIILSKDRLGVQCFDQVDTNAALDCWIDKHPDVGGAMYYGDSSFNGTWSTWPTAVRDQLHTYFNRMAVWYKVGMPSSALPPPPFPEPIQKMGPSDPVNGFWMPETLGKEVYLSQTANSLAAELTAAFPWTITTYTPDQLNLLLSMNDRFYYLSTVANPGYFFQYGGPLPATPGYIVNFFNTNNLIGSDATDTIARLFAWERQLKHFFVVTGDPTVNVDPYFWGPDAPPIHDSDVIAGTTYAGPPGNAGFGHWTAGCSGTMQFMKSVLRSMNIPVERHWVSCQHATPIFPTVGLAMTHGDDPYDNLGLVSPQPGFSTPAPSEFLIPITQLNQLFQPGQSDHDCEHTVGVQVANIAIKYGSDPLMNLYCHDLISGADHPSGLVYGLMSSYYPLQTLENMGLWTTLDTKVTATNFCGP